MCAFTGQKTQRFIEANRAFNCDPIFHSIRATKEASSPPVSMATEEPEKSRTGLPYHFHRWRKVVRIICRDSHVASSPPTRKNVLERRSRICIILEIYCATYFKRKNGKWRDGFFLVLKIIVFRNFGSMNYGSWLIY